MNISNVEIIHRDKPFKIRDMPLGEKVYVIDNYLETSVQHWIERIVKQSNMWSKSNKVRGKSKTGLPHHELWGASFYVGQNEDGSLIKGDCTNLQVLPGKYLNRKICTDFGFKWKRFQYMGMNSQTHGQHGTTHADCDQEDDYNLSFLYYYNKFWNPHWGGKLRFYSENRGGGILDQMDDFEIGSVDFKPNRLLMFDGRIQHGAEAPSSDARYIDRRSLVVRGDEIELLTKEERHAHD